MDYYLRELEALQTWIKATASINSVRLKDAKPKVARPIILWEVPSRSKDRNISRYVYVQTVRQYGKLFVSSLDEALAVQEKLSEDLEAIENVIPVYEAGVIVGHLKAVALEFDESDTLNIPFSVKYEVAYGKTKPADAPAATKVTTAVDIGFAPTVHNLGEDLLGVATVIEFPVPTEYAEPVSLAAGIEYPAPVEYLGRIVEAASDEKVDKVYSYAGTTKAGQTVV